MQDMVVFFQRILKSKRDKRKEGLLLVETDCSRRLLDVTGRDSARC